MHPESPVLILESRNDLDISQQELDVLADQIRTQLALEGSDVFDVAAVAYNAEGVGNHWSDVVNVFVPSVDGLKDMVWESVLDNIKSMMRARFSRPHESRRPRVIVLMNGATGEVERVLQATGPDGEFVELDAEVYDSREPPPLPPKQDD